MGAMQKHGSHSISESEKIVTILQIEYFVEIVKSGSFTKAAEKLFVTHQALSLQIRALEKELRMPLFDRSNKRKLVLLENGEILYKAWEPLLGTHRAAVREAKDSYEGLMKTVHVGVQDAPKIRDFTIALIGDYIKRNNLKPEFIVGEPETLLNKLESGELDLCSVISFSLYGKEGLMHADIGDKHATPMIVISRDHPLAGKKKLTLADIQNETIITFDEQYARGSEVRIGELFQKAGVTEFKKKVLKNVQEVKMAVCLNQGVAIELDMAMQDILDKVKLYPIENLEEKDLARIVMVWKDPKWNNILP